jgi:hypothetical protein
MTESVRRSIAYIAGRAITGQSASSIYDYTRGKHSNFSGEVSSSRVSVYDFDARCHITGTRSRAKFSLYHHGVHSHIDLIITKDSNFSGYDYESKSHFSGKVSGLSIQLYDFSLSQYFNYSI